MHYDYSSLDDAPPVVLNLWDQDDSILDSDDFLGRSVVYLKDASICEDDSIPEPKWHDIRLSFDESLPACGSMLLSFSVVADDYSYKIPTDKQTVWEALNNPEILEKCIPGCEEFKKNSDTSNGFPSK